jgi:hypothetical protein
MPSHNGKRSGNTRRGAGRPKITTHSSSSSEAPPTQPATAAKRKSKKAKPSFDVARDDLAAGSSGWVYRSETVIQPGPEVESEIGAVITAQVVPELVPAAEHLVGPADQPSTSLTAKAVSSGLEPSAPPDDAAFVPPLSAVSDDVEENGALETPAAAWIENGVNVMVLPLTIAIVAMIAPVIWMLAPRAHR